MKDWLKLFGIASVALAVAGMSSLAMAADEPQTKNGVRYVCTGFGQEAREDPRWDAYPLKLVFAQTDGDYLADVDVSISSQQGEATLEVNCDGPWLLVELPAGKYGIEAVAPSGDRRETTVSVPGSGQNETTLHFKAKGT